MSFPVYCIIGGIILLVLLYYAGRTSKGLPRQMIDDCRETPALWIVLSGMLTGIIFLWPILIFTVIVRYVYLLGESHKNL